MNLKTSENQEHTPDSSSGPALGPEALQLLKQNVPALTALIEKYLTLQLERIQATVQKNLHGFYWAVLFILMAAGLFVLGIGFLFMALASGIASRTEQNLWLGYLLSGVFILVILPIIAKLNLNIRRQKILIKRMQKHETNL